MQKLFFTDTQLGSTTLIFLHYFGGSVRTWQSVVDLLQNDFRCIAIDMLGFGNSPAPEQESTVNNNRDAVLQVLDHLQLTQFYLIGHSMGGKIALAVAAAQPNKVEEIMLFAPSPPSAEPMTDEARNELSAAFGNREKIEAHIRKITSRSIKEEWFDETVNDYLKANKLAWFGWLHKGSKEDISSEMSKIELPLMVVSGSDDKGLTTQFLQTEFKKYFSNTSFQEIEDSGHLLPLEQRDKVAAIIRSHISK